MNYTSIWYRRNALSLIFGGLAGGCAAAADVGGHGAQREGAGRGPAAGAGGRARGTRAAGAQQSALHSADVLLPLHIAELPGNGYGSLNTCCAVHGSLLSNVWSRRLVMQRGVVLSLHAFEYWEESSHLCMMLRLPNLSIFIVGRPLPPRARTRPWLPPKRPQLRCQSDPRLLCKSLRRQSLPSRPQNVRPRGSFYALAPDQLK